MPRNYNFVYGIRWATVNHQIERTQNKNTIFFRKLCPLLKMTIQVTTLVSCQTEIDNDAYDEDYHHQEQQSR